MVGSRIGYFGTAITKYLTETHYVRKDLLGACVVNGSIMAAKYVIY